MKRSALLLLWAASVLLILSSAAPAFAAGDTAFKTGFKEWRAGDFASWTVNTGVTLASDGSLTLDPATAYTEIDPYAAGAYYGGNFYNGGTFWVGDVTGPEVQAAFEFKEAIASWNADTPDGTWIEVLMRAYKGDYYTKWYNMGIWASGGGTVQRHSVQMQGDGDGYVAVDTLVLAKDKRPVTGYQLKVRLFSADGITVPTIHNLSVAYSTSAPKKVTHNSAPAERAENILNVPECSQMVYPDGGEVWCSPTSTSMVLGFWGVDPGPCEPRVKAAVAGVYDWIYDGHGNWPFNTAYAASRGMEAYVARYDSLAKLEPWIDAGIPVVMSIAWKKGELTGAPVASSNGHLVVLVGFTATGDPVVNDPAAAADADVQRTYLRGELESAWLTNSAGTVYLIYPVGHAHPPFGQ